MIRREEDHSRSQTGFRSNADDTRTFEDTFRIDERSEADVKIPRTQNSLCADELRIDITSHAGKTEYPRPQSAPLDLYGSNRNECMSIADTADRRIVIPSYSGNVAPECHF
jgi:type IV pilus biogenesis protein CpaD/CtpE